MKLAERLQGRRFVHVNASRYGSGSSEILARLVPLLQDLGIDAAWEVIVGDPAFYAATRTLEAALGGQPAAITEAMLVSYVEAAATNAATLPPPVRSPHGPRPAGPAARPPPPRAGPLGLALLRRPLPRVAARVAPRAPRPRAIRHRRVLHAEVRPAGPGPDARRPSVDRSARREEPGALGEARCARFSTGTASPGTSRSCSRSPPTRAPPSRRSGPDRLPPRAEVRARAGSCWPGGAQRTTPRAAPS